MRLLALEKLPILAKKLRIIFVVSDLPEPVQIKRSKQVKLKERVSEAKYKDIDVRDYNSGASYVYILHILYHIACFYLIHH